MIKIASMKVGTDAELPLRLATGQFFPVTGLVGGTKAEPAALGRLGPGFYIQEDNVNLEFNIPPAKSADQFNNFIIKALRQIEKELPPTMRISRNASMEYEEALLDSPQCQTFGCSPDYNVYTGTENPRPRHKNPNFRTAAAHVHVGWENPEEEDREALVKMLDLHLGFAMLRYDDTARRELYGKAGSYRPKEYGVEYRVLGNSWLFNDLPQSIFYSVLQAADAVNNKRELTKEEEAELIVTINTGVVLPAFQSKMADKFGVYMS